MNCETCFSYYGAFRLERNLAESVNSKLQILTYIGSYGAYFAAYTVFLYE